MRNFGRLGIVCPAGMKWLQISLLLAAHASYVLAGVTYDEDFGSSVGQYDIEPPPLGVTGMQPSDFDSPFYSAAPFDLANTQHFTVYVKGDKLARIGTTVSTIYDLGTGTVTVIDYGKSGYSVLSFAAMQRRIEKGRGPTRGSNIQVTDTGRTMKIAGQTACEYLITVSKGSGEDVQAVAHATYWDIQSLPWEELAAFHAKCAGKYGRQYPAVCSLTESTGFGMLSKGVSGLEGYPVVKIVESRMSVPPPYGGSTSPAEIYPADRSSAENSRTAGHQWRGDQAPSFARIVRTETRISNFREGPVDDSHFAIPKGYKGKKN